MLVAAFPGCDAAVPASLIEANSDLTLLKEPFDLELLVPAYMLWCVRNSEQRDSLVPDHTVAALGVLGRTKSVESLRSFKATCTEAQRAAIAEFLRWCLSPERLLIDEHVRRALKHWV